MMKDGGQYSFLDFDKLGREVFYGQLSILVCQFLAPFTSHKYDLWDPNHIIRQHQTFSQIEHAESNA